MRACSVVLGLVALLAGVVVMLFAAGLVAPVNVETPAVVLRADPTDVSDPLLWGAVGLLLVLGGFASLLAASRRRTQREAYFVIGKRHSPLYGESVVMLSRWAARALAAHAAESVPGVLECDPHVSLGRHGWAVDARVSVKMSEPLPELMPELNKAVRGALERTTGLPVEGVRFRSTFAPLSAGRGLR